MVLLSSNAKIINSNEITDALNATHDNHNLKSMERTLASYVQISNFDMLTSHPQFMLLSINTVIGSDYTLCPGICP